MKQNLDESLALSLVRDDLPFRLQRRIGLIPERGLGISSPGGLFRLAYLAAYRRLGRIRRACLAWQC